MHRYLKAILIAAIATVIASAIFGTLATIWYQNGVSERTLSASFDAFLFFTAFTTPAALIMGIPISTRISRKFFPIAGACLGAVNAAAWVWLDHFFNEFGVEFPWLIYGVLHGALVGLVAYGIARVTGASRIK